jgi:hypothetical protein
LEGLAMEDVDIFGAFMAARYILLPLVIVFGYLVYFWNAAPRKIWQP